MRYRLRDFHVVTNGSIAILTAVTEDAEKWVAANLPDDALTWDRNGSVIEPRYLGPILNGIEADGLTLQEVQP